MRRSRVFRRARTRPVRLSASAPIPSAWRAGAPRDKAGRVIGAERGAGESPGRTDILADAKKCSFCACATTRRILP